MTPAQTIINIEEKEENDIQNQNIFGTYLAVEFNSKNLKNEANKNYFYVGTNQGEIVKFSIQPIIEFYDLQLEKDHKKVTNYNPYR